MNIKIAGILFLLIYQSIFSQNASTYFPSQTGYKWNYESIPLDSLNNPVNSQKFYSIDSFAVTSQYNGKNANVVLSKTGPQSTINFQPYLDTLFYNFESTNGFEYFDPTLIAGLLGNLDTTLGINFLNFFKSLESWYAYYRLASNVNTFYQIFSKDTIVIVDSIGFPIRFELIGKRLSDETINTAIGTFDCKKFLLERRLSYLVIIPFLQDTLAFKILGVEENVWLAPDNWKVKSYIPTTNVDLSYLGFPSFRIPGLESNITTPITGLEENKFELVYDFELYQNYPNPFNPSTRIRYTIPNVISTEGRNLNVVLKVFDILGNEVATLVNEEKPAGNYEVKFNPAFPLGAGRIKNLPAGRQGPASGTYFYQLKVGNFVQTKKMILIK